MRRLPAAAALALALTAFTGLPSAAAAEPAASSTVPAATSTTSFPDPLASTTSASTTSVTVTSSSTTTTTTPPPTIGGPAARAQAAPAQATVTITTDNGDCFIGCFSPMTTTIVAGGTVTFRNPTDLDHTVKRCTAALCNGNDGGTGVDADFSQGTFALPPDVSFELTFAQPGTYVYYCSLHGYAQMHGTITVTAAEPATTLAPATLPPTVAPTAVVEDPNGLANTGGTPVPLLGIAGAFLVVGLAATGLAARRRTEHDR